MSEKVERKRKNCEVCGMEVYQPGGRGRPPTMCGPETGRDCRRMSWLFSALRAKMHDIVGGTPSASRDRARSRIAARLKDIRAELYDE